MHAPQSPVDSSSTPHALNCADVTFPSDTEERQAAADGSPFKAQEFIARKDTVNLAPDILALDQDAFNAAFRKSPMKRAKLAGLKRNAEVAMQNAHDAHG